MVPKGSGSKKLIIALQKQQLTLRLVDKLFSKEVLMCSTVHGMKDFSPLDQKIVAAIKGKLHFTAYPSFFSKAVSVHHTSVTEFARL